MSQNFDQAWLDTHYAKLRAPVAAVGGKHAVSVQRAPQVAGLLRLVLRGSTPSKKNKWKRGRRGMYLEGDVVAVLDAMEKQARSQYKGLPLEHPRLTVTFYVSSRRQDRDNMLTATLDVLVRAEVLRDDNIRRLNGEIILRPAVIVKADERVEIEIEAAIGRDADRGAK